MTVKNDCYKKLANDLIAQMAQVNNEPIKPSKKLKKVTKLTEQASSRMDKLLLADRGVVV